MSVAALDDRSKPERLVDPTSTASRSRSGARRGVGPRARTRPPEAAPGVTRDLRETRGQAAVELVLVLPILLGLAFLIFDLAIVVTNYMRVTDAARVVARAAAVYRFTGEPNACQAAQDAAADAAGGLSVTVSCGTQGNPGDPFTVTVTYPWSIGIPLIPLSASGTLTSKATDRLE
jgi:Flp pilus assembly protein TadG